MMIAKGVRDAVAATRKVRPALGYRIRFRVLLKLFEVVMRDMQGSGPAGVSRA
jgi:hypothetical protein